MNLLQVKGRNARLDALWFDFSHRVEAGEMWSEDLR